MGNFSIGRTFGLSPRNKELLSVAPSPSSHGAVEATKIAQSKGSKNPNLPEAFRNFDDIARQCSSNQQEDNDDDLKHKRPLDFQLPEGKLRRENLADAEGECSQISELIYVGGSKVSRNYDLLKQIGIKRIVNCAAVVVPNTFEGTGEFRYLSLNLLDGRQEDISWFVCQAIQFILDGTSEGHKVLLHCEKGISRSTSFAIAHRIWEKKEGWKVAYDYVKTKRKISSPNTAFTCNIIELAELFHGGPSTATLLFRCAFHAPHDPETAVLKLCRNNLTRRILVPSTSLLNPIGVFVIRAVYGTSHKHDIYIWQGQESSERALVEAVELAKMMYGVFSLATTVQIVKQGEENAQFLSLLVNDGPFNSTQHDASIHFADYLGTCQPTEAELNEAALILRTSLDAQQQLLALPLMSNEGRDDEASVTSVTTSTKEKSINVTASSHRGFSRPVSNLSSNRGNNNANNNMTIAAAISRSNSFSSVDSDGVPLLSNTERLSKIQMIVDSATSNSPAKPEAPPLSMAKNVETVETVETTALTTTTTATTIDKQPSTTSSSPTKLLPKLPLGNLPLAEIDEAQLSGWRDVEQETISQANLSRRADDSDEEEVCDDEEDDERIVMMTAPPVHNTRATSSKLGPSLDLNLSRVAGVQSYNPSPLVTGASRADVVLTTRSLQVSLNTGNSSTNRSISSNEGQRSQSRLPNLPLHVQDNNNDRPRSSDSQHSNSNASADGLGRSPSKMRLPLGLAGLLGGGGGGGGGDSSRPHSTDSRGALRSNPGRVAPDPTMSLSPSSQRLPPSSSRTGLDYNEPFISRQANEVSGIAALNSAEKDDVLESPGLSKPMLFQAELTGDDGMDGEWVSMGIYDDSDLDENEMYLLLCPESPHFLWIGQQSRMCKTSFLNDDSQLQNWAVNTMGAGDIADYDVLIVESDLSIQRSGSESDEFWDHFNEGF